MIVKERLYLTANRKKVVKEGDKRAAFLLAAKGQELPNVIARQYGLLKEKKKIEKVEDKKVSDSENKGSGKEKTNG